MKRLTAILQLVAVAIGVWLGAQSLPGVQRYERRVYAQVCAVNNAATSFTVTTAFCNFGAIVFANGLQVGLSGVPISGIIAVTLTANGATEVDVTPTGSMVSTTAGKAYNGAWFCSPQGGTNPVSGVGYKAWQKNATQVGFQSVTGDTAQYTCVSAQF